MATSEKNNSIRLFIVATTFFVVAILVAIKLINIQWVEGKYYKKLAQERTVKNFDIPANKGNIYSSDGSLLATSIPEYTIRFDAMAPQKDTFNLYVAPLANALGNFFNKSADQLLVDLRKARATKNRYLLIARNLSYTEYLKIKSFPLFKKGMYQGGIIVEQKTVRKHPIGKIAERTVGYERKNADGTSNGKGIEYAFRTYLNGENGHRMMQKIAKSQWKPISDVNEKEPRDGYDIVSTINVYIQDIAHHALLKQLQEHQAEYGCVVVMETATGEVKAISNLGRDTDGSYFEKENYAVKENHEPGSTFKLFDIIALLEDKKVDTSKIYNTFGGEISYYKRKVIDSHTGGYGKISLARGFELSSNTVLVQAVTSNYKDNPNQFIKRIEEYKLDQPIGIQFVGEATPYFPKPGTKGWSGIALPWMAFGYGISMTPLQTLTFYNAVANDGKMIKPIFVKEIKEWDNPIKTFQTEVIHPKICSDATLKKVRKLLENVVKKGTASDLYSENFSMAGKTGTAQMNYKNKANLEYSSSFVGYFPAEEPKYSCIVVINKPNKATGKIYGADVAGPVFKRIAQKIFTDAPSANEIKDLDTKIVKQEKAYLNWYSKQNQNQIMPNVKNMPAMDAVSFLENKNLKVKIRGRGKVKNQSILPGQRFAKNQIVLLELE